MATKTLKTRVINKHETEANWRAATGFVPLEGEVIVYDPDSKHQYARLKVGNNIDNVNDLPFVTHNSNGGRAYKIINYTYSTAEALDPNVSIYNGSTTLVLNTVEGISNGTLVNLEMSDSSQRFAVVASVNSATNTVSLSKAFYDENTPVGDVSNLNCYLVLPELENKGDSLIGDTGYSFGINNRTLAEYTFVTGEGNSAEGRNAFVSGENNIGGYNALVGGEDNVISAEHGFGVGYKNTATARYAAAIGYNNKATGPASLAVGDNTEASGVGAFAQGYNTTASGSHSHAEGASTKATGVRSHAEGYSTEALGARSHVEGYNTVAQADDSHAEGRGSKTSGTAAHAEGVNSEAKGWAAHAEGEGAIAEAPQSHAQNYNTHAKGQFSSAAGISTVTHENNRNGQFVVGKYNVGKEDTLFEVGNGTGLNSRANALEVKTDGTVYSKAGKLATEAVVDTKIAALVDSAPDELNTLKELADALNDQEDIAAKLVTDVANKVDKVEGKQLSTNDFTDGYKKKLDNELVGEFTVDGSDYGQNDYKDIRGEIFNDYSNNHAIAPGAHAEGTRGNNIDNVAGCKGYEIKAKSAILGAYTDPQITISSDRTTGTIKIKGNVKDTANHGSGIYKTPDVFSLITDKDFEDCGTITSIKDVDSSGITEITVTFYVDRIVGLKGTGDYGTGLGAFIPTVTSAVPFIFKVNSKPLTGNIVVGIGAHTEGVGNQALADGAHAEGRENRASGRYSHAEGYGNIAAYGAHAEGYNNQATGNYTHAEGQDNTASGHSAHAEGHTNIASGGQSHAEGHVTTASGLHSHAEGSNTKATNEQSHAEGNGTTSSGIATHAEGYKTTASGNYGHAEGHSAKATGEISHAEGYSTEASSAQSHAEGHSTKAQGNQSHAEGQATIASGAMSHAEGYKTQSQGSCSHAGGDSSISVGNCSFAHGNNVKTSKNNQAAFGLFNNNKEDNIFEIGNGTAENTRSNAFEVTTTGIAKASGKVLATEEVVDQKIASFIDSAPETLDTLNELAAALGDDPNFAATVATQIGELKDGKVDKVEGKGLSTNDFTNEAKEKLDSLKQIDPNALVGKAIADGGEIFNDYTNNQASGSYSHAEGSNTRASGKSAHAEGLSSVASNDMAHAEGLGSKATGAQSHAEGHSTQAAGNQSHAEGHETIASGEKSHAEGWKTESYGGCSHAGGMSAKAKGAYSFAQGNNVIAGSANQAVVGLFNNNKSDNLFEVGNGTSENNRSNAFEVTKSGVTKAGGKTLATEQYVDEKVANVVTSSNSTPMEIVASGTQPTPVAGKTIIWIDISQSVLSAAEEVEF